MSSERDPSFDAADGHMAAGDEAAARGDMAGAREQFELALEGFRTTKGEKAERAEAEFGQAQVLRRLGDLAEQADDRKAAREHYAAALTLLPDVFGYDPKTPKPLAVYLFMQVARMDALADRPEAEELFRSALGLATSEEDRDPRSVIWHYVGAYCIRRELPVASFLSHQQSLEELPADADGARVLEQLREQLRALQDLDEIDAALATMRVLENQNALSDENLTVEPTADVIQALGLAPEAALELSGLLDKPENLQALRQDVVARMRAAVPDFARRFVEDELKLEDTRSARPAPSR